MMVAVCVPAHDQVPAFWAYDFARMLTWSAANIPDIQIKQLFTCGTIISDSRERLVNAALKANPDYVLFVDADMRFPKDALKRLLERKLPAVSVNYSSRQEPFWPQARAKITNELEDRVFQGEGVEQVAANGFGMMLIEAEYLRRMEPPRFALGYAKSGGMVTEDMFFCAKLKGVDAPLYVDHDLSREVAHIGVFEFTLEHSAQYITNEIDKARSQQAELDAVQDVLKAKEK